MTIIASNDASEAFTATGSNESPLKHIYFAGLLGENVSGLHMCLQTTLVFDN